MVRRRGAFRFGRRLTECHRTVTNWNWRPRRSVKQPTSTARASPAPKLDSLECDPARAFLAARRSQDKTPGHLIALAVLKSTPTTNEPWITAHDASRSCCRPCSRHARQQENELHKQSQ